jgi:hypothetical protein
MPKNNKRGQNDYTNFNNTIKRLFPEFDDIGSNLMGREANFVQQQMNETLNEENPVDSYGNNAFQAFTIASKFKEKKNG